MAFVTSVPLEVNITLRTPDDVNMTMAPAYIDFYNNAQQVTGLICYPIFCVLGLIGNVLILIVLAQKSMQTSTNVYLSALAVSDIIKLMNDSLYFLTVLLLQTHPPSGNKAYGYLYPYAHFVFNMAVCVSSWLTVSVAVERFVLVCHPARSKGLITISRARMLSTACFVLMTALAVPSALRYQTVSTVQVTPEGNVTILDVKLTPLWKNQTFVTSYTWLQSLLRSIIPLFILFIMNAFIINALRKTRANKKLASRNKITIMLIIVIIFFLMFIIPDAIMSAFFRFGYAEAEDYRVKGVREITDMLLGMNAAINFALYMTFNKIFRDQFISLFCGQCYTPKKPSGRGGDSPTRYRRVGDQNRMSDKNKMADQNKMAEDTKMATNGQLAPSCPPTQETSL